MTDSIGGPSKSLQFLTDRLNARNKNFERLSSGRRINKASDDAASLAIASALGSELKVRSQASRNLSDGISLTNIADGALGSGVDIQQRLSELATQSANGTLSDAQRQSLNAEYQALNEELGRIQSTTEFNGIKLFDSSNSISLQGASGEAINISPGKFEFAVGGDISTLDGAKEAIDLTKNKGQELSNIQAALGASTSALSSNLKTLNDGNVALSQALGQITDVDIASEVSQSIANQIGLQAGVALAAQNPNSANAANLLSNS